MQVTLVMLFLTPLPNSTDHALHALAVRTRSQKRKTGTQVLLLPEKAQTQLFHSPETTQLQWLKRCSIVHSLQHRVRCP